MSICLRDKFTSVDCIRSITPFAWLANNGECPRLEKSSMLRFSLSPDITIARQLFASNWTGNGKPSLLNPLYSCISWALVMQAGVVAAVVEIPFAVSAIGFPHSFGVNGVLRRRVGTKAKTKSTPRCSQRTAHATHVSRWLVSVEIVSGSVDAATRCAHNSGQSTYVHTCERTYAKRAWEIRIGLERV